MKRSLPVTILLSLFIAACASGGARTPADPNLDETRWRGDPRLYHMLLPYPIAEAQQDSLLAYARMHGGATNYLLAEAAEDVNAPVVVRVNALHTLAARQADRHMTTFRNALDAEDVRIRATAVAAMRQFAVTHPREAVSIARMALSDPEAEVQAQALQVLGDSDIDLLRDYMPRAANDDLRAIAEDLVQLAEQRGAPLVIDTTTGILTRRTHDGYVITFTPATHWPEWDAGYGSVTIARDGVVVQTLHNIEAVGGVIPVFLSPDARHVVFERDRTIVVRAMADGSERVAGEGIAPRPRPFTGDFVFLRERPDAAVQRRNETDLAYDVYVAPFDPPGEIEPVQVGTTTATAAFERGGAYSPVRWMRVEERSGHFYLTSSHMETVPLPDPFG